MSLTDIFNKNEQVMHTDNLCGIDTGFGSYKITSGSVNISFPSIVGTPVSEFAKNMAINSLDELLASLAIVYQGQTYYVGHNAIVNTRNGKISLRQNKADNDEQTKIKIMTALALLTNEDQYEATFDIIGGLPVLEFHNQKDKLYSMFYNNGQPFEFVMKYGNHNVNKKIKCRNIKIISQGEGIFYNYILDSQAAIIPQRAANVNGIVAVCDIGFKTLDFVSMENGRYLETTSSQVNEGVSMIHQEVLRLIMQELNIKKELKDIDTIVRNKELFFGTKTYDMTDIIRRASEPFAESIVEHLYTINNGELGNLQMILLAGGGAELIYEYVKEKLKNVVNVEKIYNSEFGNANGYYKYGKLLQSQQLW